MAAAAEEAPVCVPWGKLLAWVQQQIDSEMQTGRPVVLSRTQLEAVSHLVSFDDEPDVSDKDYVSLLLHHVQSRRLHAPVFANREPVSMPVDGHFEPRWQCVCSMQSIGEFPRPGYGISATGGAPRFQSKKNAKQFAAKQALEYLKHHTGAVQPPSLVPNKRPLPISPPKETSQPQQWEAAAVASTARDAHAVPLASSTAAAPPHPDTASPARKQSIFERVALLMTLMGIDSPSYVVEPDPAAPGLFRGWPVFSNGGRLPLRLGVVNGVESRAQAKTRIAEAVLDWAEAEALKRDGIFQSLWGKAP